MLLFQKSYAACLLIVSWQSSREMASQSSSVALFCFVNGAYDINKAIVARSRVSTLYYSCELWNFIHTRAALDLDGDR